MLLSLWLWLSSRQRAVLNIYLAGETVNVATELEDLTAYAVCIDF